MKKISAAQQGVLTDDLERRRLGTQVKTIVKSGGDRQEAHIRRFKVKCFISEGDTNTNAKQEARKQKGPRHQYSLRRREV